MQYTLFHEYQFSQLMLGTVQLGLPYGIANTSGQPDYGLAKDILACAWAGGVTAFDTAAMYGESEAVLGRAFAELGISEQVVVATKVRHLAGPYTSPVEVERVITDSVEESRRLLRMDCLPLVLFHREEDFRYIDVLLELQARGWVRHVGASVMTPATTQAILASGKADAIQLPTHLLDSRFLDAGAFSEARRNGVALFVRSVYFQGLLLMPDERVPAHLAAVLPVRRALRALAAEAGMGLDELAVRYILGLDGMTALLLGVETVAQMEANLALVAKGLIESPLMEAVRAIVPPLPDKIMMPNLWAG